MPCASSSFLFFIGVVRVLGGGCWTVVLRARRLEIHLITERTGPPLSIGVSGANLHDSQAP